MVGNQANHLLAFYTNNLASDAVNTALGVVADQAITFGTTTYFLGDPAKVIAAYAQNDGYTDVRINSPSLRDPFLPHLDPLRVAATVPDVPPVLIYGDDGPTIPANENFSVEASRGTVVASDAYVLLWLSFYRKMAPIGPRIKARFTSAVTIAEGTWSVGALTFADTLPAGSYAVVGLSTYGTNLLASRLVFQGGGYRPGVLAQQAQGEWNGPSFPRDLQGEFGRFLNTVQPNIEHFGIGAGTSQIGYMDLVRL